MDNEPLLLSFRGSTLNSTRLARQQQSARRSYISPHARRPRARPLSLKKLGMNTEVSAPEVCKSRPIYWFFKFSARNAPPTEEKAPRELGQQQLSYYAFDCRVHPEPPIGRHVCHRDARKDGREVKMHSLPFRECRLLVINMLLCKSKDRLRRFCKARQLL